MKKLFIANTNFEFELSANRLFTPQELLAQSPICLQLQFLPLLFANPEDEVLVTAIPEGDYGPTPVLEARDREIHSWGWSKSIAAWATKHGSHYHMPSWGVVKEVNSKEWSFTHSPKLDGAKLVASRSDFEAWNQFPAVAKCSFGLSGRGNKVFYDLNEELLSFCEKEWQAKRPVIVEPWVERVIDFSTQWMVEKENITFLGATKLLNSPTGTYLGTVVGEEKAVFEEYYPFFVQHLEDAKKILKLAQEKGYFGYAGIDAMVYRRGQELCLQPFVEVNARMTMALAAIFLQKKMFPDQTILFQYGKFDNGLLPKSLQMGNKIIKFNRQLQVIAIDG